MTGEIYGYNDIPEGAVKDQESLLRFVDSLLKPNGVEYYVKPLIGSSAGDYQSTEE